jgi:hypothetical protein
MIPLGAHNALSGVAIGVSAGYLPGCGLALKH